MTDFRYPNESEEYRARRNELLELESDLRARVDAVAAKRRELPLGGALKDDYRFESARGETVPFADLFGPHESLLVYSMMFGSDWDAPCPSCASIVDALNANYVALSHHVSMVVVAAAKPEQLRVWGERRNWKVPLYSGASSDYLLDYFPFDSVTDPGLVSMMNVFQKTPDGVFHTWGSELVGHPKENGHPNHVDPVWPFWNLLDMTRIGRGDISIPKQDYEHDYFTRKVYPGEG